MTYKLGKDGWPTDETVIDMRDREIESLRQQLADLEQQYVALNEASIAAIKAAKREALLEAANKAKPYSYRLSSEFERMAKELE